MRMDSDAVIDGILKQHLLKKTRARAAVLRALMGSKGPTTHEEIAGEIGTGTADKVTIYRTLAKFIEKDIVHRAFIKERAWYYELADNCTEDQCHPHFTCNNCGDTHCLFDADIGIVKGLKKGFLIHRQQVRLEGLCPACSQKG